MPKSNHHIIEQNMRKKDYKGNKYKSSKSKCTAGNGDAVYCANHLEIPLVFYPYGKDVWKHIVTLVVSQKDSWHIVLFIDECGSGVYSGMKVVFTVRNQVQSGISM